MTQEQDRPVVAVVMGSDSDWPVMEAAVSALEEFDISCRVEVLSAHRMPQQMLEFGQQAEQEGLRVIIAGAGGAAHLPGMLASVTALPVIGVPVKLKTLDGWDSLLSIVQMPGGIPVATVSIDGARNAGLLAARILGAGEGPRAEEIRTDLRSFTQSLEQTAQDKGAALSQRLEHRRQEQEGERRAVGDRHGSPEHSSAPEHPEHSESPAGGYAP